MSIDADALRALLKQHIKVDATGLSPAVASAFVTGFDEAVEAIRSTISEETARAREAMRKRCLGLVQVEIDAVSRVEDDLIATGGENDSLSYAGHRASLQMIISCAAAEVLNTSSLQESATS